MKKWLSLIILLGLTLSTIVGQVKTGGTSKVGGTVKSTVQSGLVDFVTDTFTEAGTGTVRLDTHVGELGATWTAHPAATYNSIAPLLNRDADDVFGDGTDAAYASGVPADADYEVCADFFNVTTIAVNIGIAGRMDTTADTMYLARLNSGTTWNMRKIVAATATDLGTNSTNNLPTAGGAAKRGCLVMTGDQISFKVEGVTEIGPVTDAAITAAGRAGIRTAGVSSATTGMHIDNFSAKQ